MAKLKLLILPLLGACLTAIVAATLIDWQLLDPMPTLKSMHTQVFVGMAFLLSIVCIYLFFKGKWGLLVSYFKDTSPPFLVYGAGIICVVFTAAAIHGLRGKFARQVLRLEHITQLQNLDQEQNLVLGQYYFEKTAAGASRPLHTKHLKNGVHEYDDLLVAFCCPVHDTPSDTAQGSKIWLGVEFYKKYNSPMPVLQADSLTKDFALRALDTFLMDDSNRIQYFHYFPAALASDAKVEASSRSAEFKTAPPQGYIVPHYVAWETAKYQEIKLVLLVMLIPWGLLVFVFLVMGVRGRANTAD